METQTRPVTSQKLSKDFLLGGHAIFTVANPGGIRYTFKVWERKKFDGSAIYFIGWLTGPDNENDYTYIGVLAPETKYTNRKHVIRLTAKSQVTEDSKVLAVARWIAWVILLDEMVPDGYFLNHAGRCGRCGRTLTVPESLERGIGPECWSRLAA